MSNELLETQKRKSSGLPSRLARLNKNTKAATGKWGKFGRLAAEKGRTIREITQNPLLWNKTKEKEEKKNKAGSTLIQARRKPTRAVCSGWSYPIQAELSLVLGGVPVLPTFRGPSCGSSASDRWRVWPFTRLHRQRAEPGSSPHCPSETP